MATVSDIGVPGQPATNLTAWQAAVRDGLLREAGVWAYATAAERTLALPAPVEGTLTYLRDVDRLEVWNGTAWKVTNSLDIGTAFMTNTINNVPANTSTRLNLTTVVGTNYGGGVTLTGGCLQVTTPGRWLVIARAWWTASLAAATLTRVMTGTDTAADTFGGTLSFDAAGASRTIHDTRLMVVTTTPQKFGLWVQCSLANSPVGGSLEVTYLGP